MKRIQLLSDYPESAEWIEKIPEKMWKNCELLRFSAGKRVFSREDASRYLYLICAGTVLICNLDEFGNEMNVVFVESGSILGEMEILLGYSRMVYGAKAYTDCVLLRMLAADFRSSLEPVPEFSRMILEDSAKRLYQSSSNTIRYHDKVTIDRLRTLLCFHQPGVVKKTRQELAEACGVSERTVQRAVKALKEEGALTLEKGKIVLTQEQIDRMCRQRV